MGYTRSRNGVDDGWPWSCTRCGTTIYHDGDTCRECGRATGVDDRPRSPGSWTEWMRRQSYPAFVTRVAALAGAELLLTVLWMRVLFAGAVLPV